ncbi:hypothetical protein [Tsukamurella soli]|uniref:DUF4129 domain-containing protein n=1 Tax=Tsukamurella soli TaxID=644556 RepID=A0ABP8JUL3_9ACTN
MPGDLLRYLGGPQPYAVWWLLLAAVLVLVVLAWFAAVVVWTLPVERLRRSRVLGPLHHRLMARRFTRRARRIVADHGAGRIPAGAACSALRRTLRSFLRLTTGRRVDALPTGEFATVGLSAAVPVLRALDEAQFAHPQPQELAVASLGGEVERVIASWT